MARLGFEASKKKTLCCSPIALTPPRYSLTKNWTLLLSQLGLLSLSVKKKQRLFFNKFFFNCLDIEDVNKVLRSPTT